MKHILLPIVLSGLFVISCGRKDNTIAENKDIKTIKIEVEGCEKNKDISGMFDTSFFRIIPLETKPECLLGSEIKQVFYRKDRVYIVEEMAKGIFVFDDNGKFITKIQSYGQGPEEYLSIKAVSITDDKILILDGSGRKVLIYDLDCNYLGQFGIGWKFPAHDMFATNDRIYYVSALNEVKKDVGPYRLCSTDIAGRDFQKYIPFDPDTVWPCYTGTNGIYTDISDNVKLMYKHTDTVYNAGPDGVHAEYVIDLGDRALPEYFRTNMGEARKPENRKKYINGFLKMLETKDKLIFHFQNGIIPRLDADKFMAELKKDYKKAMKWYNTEWPTIDYFAFYDKNTGETEVTNGLSVEWLGMYKVVFQYCDYPYLLFVEESDAQPSKADMENDRLNIPHGSQYEKRYKEVVTDIKEGDNPIVFVYKLKR